MNILQGIVAVVLLVLIINNMGKIVSFIIGVVSFLLIIRIMEDSSATSSHETIVLTAIGVGVVVFLGLNSRK
jgi:hypothetical protein